MCAIVVKAMAEGVETRHSRIMAEIENHFASLEVRVADMFEHNNAEHVDFREEILKRVENLEDNPSDNDIRLNSLDTRLDKLTEVVESLKLQLNMCMRQVEGLGNREPAVAAPRVDMPRPKVFRGNRNAKDFDTFWWSLERYLSAIGMERDKDRITTAAFYLEDNAQVWWRRKLMEMDKGLCTVETWQQFKKLLKDQFYPSNVQEEAWGKLRRLQHKGSISEYVKNFTELVLELDNYPEEEAFFAFRDGLQPWAKQELRRHGVDNLSQAISVAEGLTNFKNKE